MPNVYFIGLFAVLVVSGLAGSYLKGRSDGTEIVTAKYAIRDVKAAADYAAETKKTTDAYRAQEAKWSQQVATVSKDYQRRLANAETSKVAAMDSLRAGTLKLRLTDTTDCQAGGSSAASVSGSPAGRDGPAGGQFLGPVDSAFLIAEASRADAIVGQLTACQSVLAGERQ